MTSVPTVSKTVVDVNCFFGLDRFACLDNDSGNYVEFTEFGEGLIRKCTFTACYDIPSSEASKAQTHIDNTRTAHARQRREMQTTPSHPPRMFKPSPSLSPEQRTNEIYQEDPTAFASLADFRNLEQHLLSLHQTNLFNFVTLQHRMLEIQRVSLHTILSLSKLDDYLLSHLFDHHFKTQLLNYDHFLVQHNDFTSMPNSNCNENKTKIFHCGRYVSKSDSEKCITWSVKLLRNSAL